MAAAAAGPIPDPTRKVHTLKLPSLYDMHEYGIQQILLVANNNEDDIEGMMYIKFVPLRTKWQIKVTFREGRRRGPLKGFLPVESDQTPVFIGKLYDGDERSAIIEIILPGILTYTESVEKLGGGWVQMDYVDRGYRIDYKYTPEGWQQSERGRWRPRWTPENHYLLDTSTRDLAFNFLLANEAAEAEGEIDQLCWDDTRHVLEALRQLRGRYG